MVVTFTHPVVFLDDHFLAAIGLGAAPRVLLRRVLLAGSLVHTDAIILLKHLVGCLCELLELTGLFGCWLPLAASCVKLVSQRLRLPFVLLAHLVGLKHAFFTDPVDLPA